MRSLRQSPAQGAGLVYENSPDHTTTTQTFKVMNKKSGNKDKAKKAAKGASIRPHPDIARALAHASAAHRRINALVRHLQASHAAAAALAAAAPPADSCTLDTVDEVEAVVIAALQLRFPHIAIESKTKLGDSGLGMTPEAQAVLLPGMMRDATSDGGCQTRLGSGSYRKMSTVQDIIDAIWADLQDKCDL